MPTTPRKFDVAVIGNVGIDTNIYHPDATIDFDVEANFTENLDCIGQAGGYSARGYAQLGYRTAFIGYIGDDPWGRYIHNTLSAEGINLDAVSVDPAGTSRSVNFMFADGSRKNFYDGKGHMTLSPDLNVCAAILTQAKLAHFHIPNWARCLLPIAKKAGVIISCDIQDIDAIDDPYRADFIKFSDILFFSNVNHTSPATLMERILNVWPDKIMMAGMGANGCALGTHTGIEYFDAVPMDRAVVDTNGAGDGLAVGFLSSRVLDGRELIDSIHRAQIVARYTCTLRADTSHLITKAQLETYAQKRC